MRKFSTELYQFLMQF